MAVAGIARLVFFLLVSPVFCSDKSANDPRPVFDIVLDIDGTIIHPVKEGQKVPEGYKTFVNNKITYVIAPYFTDFVESLIADTKTQFRIRIPPTKSVV